MHANKVKWGKSGRSRTQDSLNERKTFTFTTQIVAVALLSNDPRRDAWSSWVFLLGLAKSDSIAENVNGGKLPWLNEVNDGFSRFSYEQS
jgi:hypothetical protein